MNINKNKIKWWSLAALFLIAAAVWYAVAEEGPSGRLTVAFLDIGQGDAIFIESPTGNQALLDGGPDRSVLRQLRWVMPFYDRSLDLLLESHSDSDHIAGLASVLRSFSVIGLGETLEAQANASSSNAFYQAIERLVKENNLIELALSRGMRIDLGGGAYLEVLSPDRRQLSPDTNAASIVAKLVYGETSFLLTGDVPENIESYLAGVYGAALESDVYKVSHHGSKNSNLPAFIGFIAPKYAVISVGADNRYGHPNQEVLDTLNRFGATILRTDQAGTIIFESDGENLEVKK